MTYIKKSVARPGMQAGLALRLQPMLTLYVADEIKQMPATDENGVMLDGEIVLKPGCYGIQIYGTPGTVEMSSNGEGDTDMVGFQPSVKFKHPGNSREVREFKANCINERFVVLVHQRDGHTDVLGTPFNPCKMTPAYTANGESTSNEFTFQQISKGDDIMMYDGTVQLEEPAAVLTPAENAIAISANGRYAVESGNVASITGANAGLTVALTVGEGTTVTLANSGNIVGGASAFGAYGAGSVIQLKSFKHGEQLIWVVTYAFKA